MIRPAHNPSNFSEGLINDQESSTYSGEQLSSFRSQHSLTSVSSPSVRITAKKCQQPQQEQDPQPNSGYSFSMFPFLKDQDLVNVPVNYFLYLGFFHICIRMFLGLLIFSIIVNVVYLIVAKYSYMTFTEDALIFSYSLYILLAGFLLRFIRSWEEKKLVKHRALQNLPWTQDLFSLLVEGLPMDVTKREVAVYFNKILSSINVSGCVKNVLLMQDYYEHTKTKQEIKKTDIQLDKVKKKPKCSETEQAELQLLSKKSQLVGSLGQIEAKIINLECFRGKAIVIFDSILTKELINSYFHVFFLFQPFSRCFSSIDEKCYYRGHKLTIRQSPEPQDLIFEHLYYPQRNRVILKILAYILSLLLIGGVMLGLLAMNGLNLVLDDDITSSEVAEAMTSFGFVIGVLILGLILRTTYKFINSSLTHPSALASRVDTYNYSIFVSLLLYIPSQMVPIYFEPQIWVEQLIKITLLYFIERIAYKVIINKYNEYKNMKNNANALQINLTEHKGPNDEYDFIEGVNSAIPLVFMGFTSLILDRFAVLAIIVIALFILGGMDKYWMIKSPESFKLKSASYMLKGFRVFRWDAFCLVIAGLLMLVSYRKTLDSEEPKVLGLDWYWLLIIFLVALALYVYWTKPITTKIKNRFFKENALKTYDSVYADFPFYYHTQDPWTRITT